MKPIQLPKQSIILFLELFIGINLYAEESGIPRQPNIIFILTDDQGYGDVGRHGHPLLKTPNMDRLYDESVRFDNFYVSPSCSPTRAALLTGMHEFRNGVTHTITPREHLNIDATILPQFLKKAGYRTGFIGKWHNGNDKGYAPGDRGFDWCSTTLRGNMGEFDPDIIRNGVIEKRKGFREDIYMEEALTFITESGDQPFFCYLATFSPHTPLVAPEEDIVPYRVEGITEDQATYLGEVANIDKNLGKLLKYLDDKKLADNTIVILMNDNGETMGLDVYNADMRGCKCTIWHGGSRAMSFWRWPKHWEAHTVNNLSAHLDVLPTLCEITGAEIPKDIQAKLEGFSLVPLLESKEPIDWHNDRLLFQHVGRWPAGMALAHKYSMCGVRQGQYLLLRSRPCEDTPACLKQLSQCTFLRKVEAGAKSETYTNGNAQFHWGVSAKDRWALYDTKNDPGCTEDLYFDKFYLVEELSAAYESWWDEVFPEMIRLGGDVGKFRPVSDYVRNK